MEEEASGAGFMPYAAAGGALASYLGGQSAARSQERASRYAADMQWRQYQQQRQDAEPWRQAGIGALTNINNNMGDYTRDFTMSDFMADPGYNFRVGEGQKALERSSAVRGGRASGRTMKELLRYGQDMGSQEYGQAYDRYNNDRSLRFNRLSNLAGLGQTANNQLSNAGTNYANGAAESIYAGGNARAAGAAGAANAVGQGLNTWMNYTMANRMMPQGGHWLPNNTSDPR